MKGNIDLHIHTTASDGTMTPEQVVAHAKAAGLTAIAITDHDTVSGVIPARQAGETLGVKVVPGVEISVDYGGRDIHILGYDIQPDCPVLAETLNWSVIQRRARNERMLLLIQQDGIAVTMEELEQAYPGVPIGRPHLARVLMDWGRADSVQDAFSRWLNRGCPYYLPRVKLSMARAVEGIRRSGGVAVLAHPRQYRYSPEELHRLVQTGVEAGIRGLEVYYTGYTLQQQESLLALAEEFGLFVTGGSDFHGDNKPDIRLGELFVPQTCLEVWK